MAEHTVLKYAPGATLTLRGLIALGAAMPYRLFPRRLRERVGRRGLTLILFGIAWLIYGTAFFIFENMGTGGNFLHEQIPASAQGALWVTGGLTAIVASSVHRGHSDTFGFLAAFVPPMVVATSFFLGALAHAVTGDWMLTAVGVFGLALWGDFATIVAVCASWPEEPALPGGAHE